MKTQYAWSRINEVGEKKLSKDTGYSMHCAVCDTILIDSMGRKRAKNDIWQYAIDGHVLGNTHQSCAYRIEVKGIEDNADDKNYGKAPTEWK